MTVKRIPVEKFLPLYMKAAEQGMTREEFAKSIGIQPTTVYQRVYEMRRKGHDIPLLAAEGRTTLDEKIEAILAQCKAGKAKTQPAKQEVVAKQAEVFEESDPLADILG